MRDYLTTGEAARLIGCSQTHVNRLIRQGKLKGVNTKLGFMVDPASAEAEKVEFEERQRQRRQHRLGETPTEDGMRVAISA